MTMHRSTLVRSVSVVVAIVLGSVTLKLSGHYLPLGTIAWGISLYFLFGNVEFLPVTQQEGFALTGRKLLHFTINDMQDLFPDHI